MSGNRITPEQVLAAYEATGLIPVQEMFVGRKNDGRKCVCGLSAAYIHEVGDVGFEKLRPGTESWLIKDTLDLRGYYIVSFIAGFDGKEYECDDPQGYEDGKAAWEAVKHLAVSEE